LREAYLHCHRYERTSKRRDQRNGFYYPDLQTRFGCLRLKIARSRTRSFCPPSSKLFQRRSEDVALLVREAFLRGSPLAKWAGHRQPCSSARSAR